MKKIIIIFISLLVLFSLYKYINQIKNKSNILPVIPQEEDVIILKENQINLIAPKPLNFMPTQNYLEAGGDWKSK